MTSFPDAAPRRKDFLATPRSSRGLAKEGGHFLPRCHPTQALAGPVVQKRCRAFWTLVREPMGQQMASGMSIVIWRGDGWLRFSNPERPHAGRSSSSALQFPALEKLDKKIGQGTVFCFVENDIPLSATVSAVPVRYL